MENYILAGKRLIIEKEKETILAIPVSFKPSSVYFIIQNKSDLAEPPVRVEFKAKSTSGGSESNTIVSVEINEPVIKFKPSQVGNFSEGNYLLISAKANNNISIELSIEAF